ncbi:DUF676-domain-containing protein [Trametes gibbosa]|nr:DUF676-domain-containing protein [Trametes gibbosa]
MSSALADDSGSTPIHLLVVLHGMWGNASHLAEMRRVVEERRCQPGSEKGPGGEQLRVFIPETNKDENTYDGIDWGGERAAEEILEEITRLEKEGKKVTRFSVTGYSLGGLVARYLVGVLYQRDFFTSITPVNFNTVATPHIGLPKYPTKMSSLFAFLGPKIMSRTGPQFFLVDKWSKNGRPLLEVMADPNRLFYQALALFQHVRIYANAVHDMTVPYPTAAIEEDDVFINHPQDKVEIEFDEEYSPIIKSYTVSPSVDQPPKAAFPSVQWFKEKVPRPMLPPPLQFGFPYNILIYPFVPVLLPLLLGLIITRLSLESRKSRTRIKLLEKAESSTERLIHIVGRLEREVEDAMVDMFDSAGPSDPSPSERTLSPSSSGTATPELTKAVRNGEQRSGLLLTEQQRKIAAWLNSLPRLKKELVFIDPVRNSHGIIICRDPKRFPLHKQGEGVLRHWADHLIL